MGTETIEIVEREAVPTLEISVRTTILWMPKRIGQSYGRLAQYIEAHQGEFSGVPYVRYLEIDWNALMRERRLFAFFKMFTRSWNLRVGFPLKQALDGEGEVRSAAFPAGQYLQTLHTGPYENLNDAYNRLYAFAKEKGLTLKPECIEEYLNDPDVVGKEALETRVLVPVETQA